MFLKITVLGCLAYAAIVTIFYFLQDSLVFPRHMVGAPPDLPVQTERLSLPRPDGVVLQGVRIAGRDSSAPTILAFPGNGTNAETMALFLHRVTPDHSVVAYHYRGYAPSTGAPSARALMDDAAAIHDSLDGPVSAVGFSIGSGVAASLAKVRDLQALILSTPFDDLHLVAADSMPFLPVRWLFRHQMQPIADLSSTTMPVTLFIATSDRVIAPARAEALAATLPRATTIRLPAGHNDIYNHPEFAPALRHALR